MLICHLFLFDNSDRTSLLISFLLYYVNMN
nr:MAG TPA: hypothetical protein [Bacteriophage sp.]DAQ31696.1 MAG TPA: hypothetical protein [Caudoviricetes sp.]DAW33608.1 MAG TPA: hypothetical protein [Caudoviricetes sp.]